MKTKNLTSDRIQDTLYGFARSQMVFTAIDLGLFTAISQGINTVDVLTHELQADPRALRIFLDGLVGISFLQKDGNCYGLPADVAKFLVKSSPHYMGGMVKHCKGLSGNWSQLTNTVRYGGPAGSAQGLADVEAFFAELVRGLYVSNYATAKEMAAFLGLGDTLKGQSILDVAGGSGVWSIALLEKDRESRATLLDYPTVINVAHEFVGNHNLTDHYEFLPVDLEEFEFPEGDYDIALLGNICHAIGPHSTEKLLRNMGKTLKSTGQVIIVDFVPDDHRAQPGWPLLFGVNMLVSTPDGDVFTEAQYREWLSNAGFGQVERHDLESEVTLIIGQK